MMEEQRENQSLKLTPVEAYNKLCQLQQIAKATSWVKSAEIWVREVEPGFKNNTAFDDFVECDRVALEGEALVKNPTGHQECWFSDQVSLYSKTEIVGSFADDDGVVWTKRKPLISHASNIIFAFKYKGEFGHELEFFKPKWRTTMKVKSGGYIVWNPRDASDIWAIAQEALPQLYSECQSI